MSKKHRRRRHCSSEKGRHDSQVHAESAARALHRLLNASGQLAITTYTYECPECRYWHLTRHPSWADKPNHLAQVAPPEDLQRWAMGTAAAA